MAAPLRPHICSLPSIVLLLRVITDLHLVGLFPSIKNVGSELAKVEHCISGLESLDAAHIIILEVRFFVMHQYIIIQELMGLLSALGRRSEPPVQ